MQAIIPINWILGTLLFFAAIFWPVLDQNLFSQALWTTAEQNTGRIVRAQITHYQLGQEKYVLFKGETDSMNKAFNDLRIDDIPADGEFLYESFGTTDGELVVRARLKPSIQADSGRPPMIYQMKLSNDQSNQQGEWLKLSRKKKGLGIF